MDACIHDRFSPCECCGRCKGKLASVEHDYEDVATLYDGDDLDNADRYHEDADNESDEEFYYDDYGVRKNGDI